MQKVRPSQELAFQFAQGWLGWSRREVVATHWSRSLSYKNNILTWRFFLQNDRNYLQRNGVVLALALYRNVHESAPIAAEWSGDRRETDTQGRNARMLRRTRLFGWHIAAVFAMHRIGWSRIGWSTSTWSSSATSTGTPHSTVVPTSTSNHIVDNRIVGLSQTGSQSRRFETL